MRFSSSFSTSYRKGKIFMTIINWNSKNFPNFSGIILIMIFYLGSCHTQDFPCPVTHLHILFVSTTNPGSNFVEIILHSTLKLWLAFILKHHCHMVEVQLLDPLHFKKKKWFEWEISINLFFFIIVTKIVVEMLK